MLGRWPQAKRPETDVVCPSVNAQTNRVARVAVAMISLISRFPQSIPENRALGSMQYTDGMSKFADEMVKRVGAVVVNWNLADETVACVDSLLAAGLPANCLYLVDNGSADDSVAVLHGRYGDRIKLIVSAKNRGFSGGNNLGIRRALADGMEWILLANNDTVVADDFFTQLMQVAESLPSQRLLGPLILYYDEPDRIWTLGDRALGDTFITRSVLRNRRVPADLPAVEPVDYLTACGLLVHREVFERIGFLDEHFFMYAEDADFCYRAQRAGFQLACATRAKMWHKVSRSTGVYHPQARYWRTCNQIRFYRRHSGGMRRLLMWAFTLLRLTELSLRDLLHGRWRLLSPTWRAWWVGWLGENVWRDELMRKESV
jgi:GT2 family glycosyltransferase